MKATDMAQTPPRDPPVTSLLKLFAMHRPGRSEPDDASAQAANSTAAEQTMLLKAASFGQVRVADVMTPRAAIVGIEASSTLAEAAQVFAESQQSRLPIYRDSLDDPLGFVHVKDLLPLLAPNSEGVVASPLHERVLVKLRRDILFVPPSMRLPILLLRMQSSHIHMALVVDEYGGTDGLVTIEDIVEQIVGDIADEHDEDAVNVVSRPNGVFEADGRTDVAVLARALGASLEIEAMEDEFDTVAGLVVALAGRLPQRGEILRHPAGFDFEILDADPRRVKRLRIKPILGSSPENAGG